MSLRLGDHQVGEAHRFACDVPFTRDAHHGVGFIDFAVGALGQRASYDAAWSLAGLLKYHTWSILYGIFILR